MDVIEDLAVEARLREMVAYKLQGLEIHKEMSKDCSFPQPKFSAGELKWHHRFLDVCHLLASWSKDRSTKTGCVIVRDRRILTTGYNGFPPGVDDSLDERHERPAKYMYTEHCERNAIYQASRFGISLDGADVYITAPPCHDCSRGIVMAGLRTVYWPLNNTFEQNGEVQDRWKDSLNVSFTILKEAGVLMVRIPE